MFPISCHIPLVLLILQGGIFALPYTHVRDGGSGVYDNAAVAADAGACSEIGANILKRDGSAVDAAVASLICVGVVNLHSTGIGGGGFMLYYDASTQKSYALDYRERAPLAASYDMYDGKDSTASRKGGLSVAVPGELRGLEMAWKRWGKLEWKELLQPSIDLARNGFPISATISGAIESSKSSLISGEYPGLVELLAPNGEFLKEGDILRRPLYADTLEKVANEGADYIYSGDFTSEMVAELREEYNSIITEQDFFQYKALERTVTAASYKDLNIFGVSPPCSGVVLGLILNILDNYNFRTEDFGSLSYHRIVEAIKFAYAQRLKLGDPAFNESVDPATTLMLDPDVARELFHRITDDQTHEQEYYMFPSVQHGDKAHDHGTSHLSVLAANGDAVACTSTINLYFGSLIRSKKNGMIYNDEMDDFSYPTRNDSNSYKQTEVNYIAPGKRPLSSTTPTIITDSSGKVKMVVGASGGFRITTSVAQVILDVLGFEKPLEESIALRRLHHQLYPNHITVERDFPFGIVEDLKKKGHEILVSGSGAVVQGIFVDSDKIYATCDARKGGQPSGY